MNTPTPTTHTTALWLGDLHLDRTSGQKREHLFDRIRATESDCLVVSGDISSARYLDEHLRLLASAASPRPVYFVAGNHEYHGSGMREVQQHLAEICKSVSNLHHLDGNRIIPLGRGVCLMGHGGWADARAGLGHATIIDNPDRHVIRDFDGLNRKQALNKMSELGKQSAGMIRNTLPLALTRYRHVVILTHVPPFPNAVLYNNKPCAPESLPHFSNLSAGLAILGIARAFPQRRITVLAGHSHSRCARRILSNLSVRVGHARTGTPSLFEILRF